MMPETTGNKLLDFLPSAVRRDCRDAGERLTVSQGEEILRQGDRARHIFFPSTAVCSVIAGLQSGHRAEVGYVGNEGLVGVSLLHYPHISNFAAVVQVPGYGYRVSIPAVTVLMHQSDELTEALLSYAGYAINMVSRLVACNSHHSLVERLARWLLQTHDRVGRDEFEFTHDIFSQVLAAARPRVSLAAAKLRTSKIINYRHGFVQIIDRKRLLQVSCECYEAGLRYQRVLPWLGNHFA